MTDVTATGVDRRRFLAVLGATGAGAALTGCSTERIAKLVPYSTQTEDQVPGLPTWYASTCTECSSGCGIHVKTREGRAIKIEGNPAHPLNEGKLCARGQSALQGLYNPGRIKQPMKKVGGSFQPVTWDEAIGLLAQQLGGAGASFAILSGAGAGTFTDLLAGVAQAGGGQLVRFEPFDHEPVRAAHKAVFGVEAVPAVDFAKAETIVSFGADFLESWGATLENQRGFSKAHGFDDGRQAMAKHVYIGPRLSLTGLNADEWMSVDVGQEAAIALAMANVLATDARLKGLLSAYTPEWAAEATGVEAARIVELARRFGGGGTGVALAGGPGLQHEGATDLCIAVALLNAAGGAVGRTLILDAGLGHGDGAAATLALLDRAAGLKLLWVHEANPLYTLPGSTQAADKFGKAAFKVYSGLYYDETAAACDLLLPNHHALERWDDVRPRTGVAGLTQPVMQPVFDTRHTGDVVLAAAKQAGGVYGRFDAASYEAHLKATWLKAFAGRAGADAEGAWRGWVQAGGVFEPVRAGRAYGVQLAGWSWRTPAKAEGFRLLATVSSLLHDGRGANRPWLLENPDPVTKMTWRPAIEVSPADAKRLDVRNGEVVTLTTAAGTVSAPVIVYPGIRDGHVAMPQGWGHTELGEFAKGRGANVLDLVTVPAGAAFVPYAGATVTVGRTREYVKLAKTEGTPRQLGRHIAEAMPVAHAAKGMTVKESYLALGGGEHDINPDWEDRAIEAWGETYQERRKVGNYAGEHPMWGMTIDLSKCTGCSSCVTACYAENNIPWVGEEQVLRGREMSWLRVERYWEGGEDGKPLEARFVPMLCQHCDNAPCETVCPVYAAYHTPDGLNGQVYNRCVGTRYCSNNCPYKVRYFNWRAYNRWAWPEPMHLQLNPEVTVRGRGVMEKCTFCIQRIRDAQHKAKLEDRSLRDGDIVTACAQACPADAIVFGDMNDPESRVRRIKAENTRGYHVLEEINVRPAVTYLAKVVHRDPATMQVEEHH